MTIYDLPNEIQQIIYSFDSTYYEIYDKVIESIRLIRFYKNLIKIRRIDIDIIKNSVNYYSTYISNENDKFIIDVRTNLLKKKLIKIILSESKLKKQEHENYYCSLYNLWGHIYIKYVEYKFNLNKELNERIF